MKKAKKQLIWICPSQKIQKNYFKEPSNSKKVSFMNQVSEKPSMNQLSEGLFISKIEECFLTQFPKYYWEIEVPKSFHTFQSKLPTIFHHFSIHARLSL